MKNITFLILFSYVQLAHSFIWHDGSGLAFYDSASDVCQLIVSGFPPEIQLVETEVQGSGASCKLERCGDDSCVDIDSKAVYSVSDQFAISLPNNNDTSSCSLAGNPINPSSGSKVQHEPLISLGSSFPLVFDLYYNSSSLDKWRHSYSRSILLTAQRNFPRYDFINGYPFGANPLADPESPGYLSGEAKSAVYGKKANMPMTAWYGTPDEACVVGWISYQSHVNYYWEDTSSASYSGNGLCEIFDTSENPPRLKMRIPVYSKYHGRSLGQFSDAGYLPPSTLRFSRQDGSVVIFEDEAGVWKNKSNTGERVETVYDVGAVNILGYRYYTAQDEIEEYDDNGRLTSISTDDGRIQKLNYFVHADTGKTLLGKVYNVSGNNEVTDELNFVYEVYGDEDQYNRVESITDNNRTWSFRYSTSNGNLEFIDNPDGTTRRYHYDNDDHPYKLTGITDENGERYASWDYDSSNKAILSAHGPDADIEKVTLSYLSGSSIVTKVKKSADGQTSKNIVSTHATQISGGAAVSASITGHDSINYEYDSLTGYIEAVQDKGLRTEYRSRDVKGNPEIIKEAVGTTEQRETSYTYDPRYHSKVETITEASVFPGNQKVTTNQYDDFGNNTAVTISGFTLSGTAVSRSITFQYNGPYHQLTQINGPRSDVSDIYTIDYYPDNATEGDNRARMKRVTAPLNITLYDNITYTPTGKIKTYTDANNVQTMLSYYFGNDRLQSLSQLDLNTADNRLTEWTYLATGEVETITTGQDLADKTTLTLIYDDARRLTGIIDGLGNTIEYILDSEGNVEQENIKDNSDNIKKQLSQTFDDYNRLQLRTQVNEQFTETWSPNGTLDKTVDGKNVTTDYSYDNLRRLTQINQDMGGSSPQTANALTILNYDVQDNLTYVKNPVNGETIYTYDDLGNQLTRDSGDTGLTTYTYDDAGNITSMLDANGETTSYSYDALNRLTSITTSNTDDDYHFEYDNCKNGASRLCKVSNTVSAQYYRYDGFGNVTGQQTLQYTYDTADRKKTISYPSGAIVHYDYDAAGQVSQVTLERNGSIVPLASSIDYEAFGDITNLLYGNALSLTQSRDSAYRPLTQSILSVFELNYTEYDENGNLKRREDTVAGTNAFFDYDAHNRLNAANGDFGVRSYEYDKNANRTKLTEDSVITSSTYDPASNRLTMRGVDNANLDNNGNMLDLGDRGYSYTKHNRLFEVFDGGVLKATYQYNGLGQRISKTLPDGTGKYFIYDTDGKLMAETDIGGNILFEYIYLNGQLLAKYTPDSDIDGISNYEEHQQGTNQLTPDTDGDGLSDLDEMFVHGTAVNNVDTDGDGLSDSEEVNLNSDPLNGGQNIGDINLDGAFNLGDYVLLTQFVLDIRVPTPTEQEQADINHDGVLNIQDMLLMQRTLLGLQVSWSDISIDNIESLFAQIYQGIIPVAYAANGDGEIFYVHNDHLGTPLKMTNEIGLVVWQAVYDPFGKAAVNEDVDGDGKTVEMNVRFPGQYYDVESELHYNYFRTYDPELGRYITSDPIGLLGGINTYAYVGGNPIRKFDIFGLLTFFDGFSDSFLNQFKNKAPNEYRFFEQYAKNINTDNWTDDIRYPERAWKAFDPYARSRAKSEVGEGCLAASSVNDVVGVASKGLNGLTGLALSSSNSLNSAINNSSFIENSSELINIMTYGPSVINQTTWTQIFGAP